MASFSCFRYFLALFLLNFSLGVVYADRDMVFCFKNFGKDSNFESQIALFGDAKVVNDSLSVQIAGSMAYSDGRVVYNKPINLVNGNSRNTVSFSSYFVFSISRENGDGLAFFIVPFGYPLNVFDGGSMGMFVGKKLKFIAIEFDTFRDKKYGDVNDNHVGIDIESPISLKTSNVSSIENLVLNSGQKLQAWIDYEASSKRFEVRLTKFGAKRPVDPFLSYPIDLSKMFKNESISVGFSSSSGNSTQKSYIYSWGFKTRTMPHWIHSEPMNPENFVEKRENLKIPKKSDCASRIIGALVFGTGCGALGAFFVLLVWAMFGNRRPIVPEEFDEQTKELEYKKLYVSLDKTVEDGKKVEA